MTPALTRETIESRFADWRWAPKGCTLLSRFSRYIACYHFATDPPGPRAIRERLSIV